MAVSASSGRLTAETVETACRIGRGGVTPAESKREGDGCTPLGSWDIKAALLRPDRGLEVPAALPWRWLRSVDGWCDASGDAAYNRPVILPHASSAEQLWRNDAAYDVIVVLGHNDAPPVPRMGSAIFLHVEIGRPTEGCVAIPHAPMIALLRMLAPGDRLVVAK